MSANTNLDLNDAALLLRVIQTRSFSAAARERGVPVSTVSRRIARLEATLGVRLLERTTRSLRLTDAGHAYHGYVERAVDELAQGHDRVRKLQAEPRGRVRVTAPIALGAAVAKSVYGYLAANPHVSIDLDLNDRRVDLLADDFDIAVVTGKLEESTEFVARQIWRATRKLLYASPRYLAAHGSPRRVDDLRKHACIATRAADGMATWTLVVGRKRRRVSFEPRFYVSEFSAAYGATLAGVGIAMLPEVYCVDDVAKKRLVQVLSAYEGEPGGVHLLYRAHRSLTAAVRSCVDHLLTELPSSAARAR